MKHEVIVLALILAMGVGLSPLFAGGGNQAGTGGTKSPAASISVEVFDRGTDGGRTDPTNNNWTKWIQEKILKEENIAVTFVAVPRGQEVPGITTMMAAGNAPDISFSYDTGLVTTFSVQGGLFDMNPYVDSHLRDLKTWLGDDEALPGKKLIYRLLDNQTGKLPAVPARRTILAREGLFIRKDWLDKLGLPLPATPQEFYNAMVAFKEKDPGGVGKDRVIPFALLNVWTAFMVTRGAFLDPNLSDKDLWIGGYLMQGGEKEAARYLNRMYNAGLIDRDFPLYNNDTTPSENLAKSGIAGSFSRDWDYAYRDSPGILTMLRQNIPNAVMEPVDPFTNSRGQTPREIYDPAGVYTFIPSYSKAPETAMRYLNWLSRFENCSFLQIGPEGIVHKMVDGIPQIQTVTGPWIQNSSYNMDYTIPHNGLNIGDPSKFLQALTFGYRPEFSDLIKKAYAMAMKDGKPYPVVPVTLTAGVEHAATLSGKENALKVTAITCPPEQFDQVWDEGIKDWLASGGQAVIDERKAKYVTP
jgi:putative aldouronate transport system substrate-binding protein